MSDMSRKEAIENLETLKAFLDVNGVFVVSDAMKKSIDIAIASLETEEAYQIQYEQPEFCVDCISRKAAIEVFKNEEDAEATSWYLAGVVFRLEDLPSVLPKVKWIPVTERLPEEHDYKECYEVSDGAVLWTNEDGLVGMGYYYESTKRWSDTDDNAVSVVAWMPLPDPYKEPENG